MSEIEMRIEKETEAVRNISAMLADRLMKCLDDDCAGADTHEVGMVVDMIKDLAEANEMTVKMLYYVQILEAMEGSEYGIDYDVDGPLKLRHRENDHI